MKRETQSEFSLKNAYFLTLLLRLEHFFIEMVKIMKGWKFPLKLLKLDFETFYIRYLLRI